jgi:hypothetical protein
MREVINKFLYGFRNTFRPEFIGYIVGIALILEIIRFVSSLIYLLSLKI